MFNVLVQLALPFNGESSIDLSSDATDIDLAPPRINFAFVFAHFIV